MQLDIILITDTILIKYFSTVNVCTVIEFSKLKFFYIFKIKNKTYNTKHFYSNRKKLIDINVKQFLHNSYLKSLNFSNLL